MPDTHDEIVGRLAVERGLLTDLQIADAKQIQKSVLEELGLEQDLAAVLVSKKLLTSEQVEQLKQAAAIETGAARRIGGYEVVAKIGAGGMGAVYEAVKLDTRERVALKILPPDLATVGMIERFRRESGIAASLKHDNIVKCVEFGQDKQKGMWFCALELIEGEDLDKYMKRKGVLSEDETVSIARQIAMALQHACFNGLVHRDVKPQNMMVTPDGTAKLLDLGLARQAGMEATQITQSGQFVGSPYYASPEQASSDRALDTRSDIYSLGATMYHMVTGSPPFSGASTAHLLYQHVNERLKWPGDLNRELSDDICQVIAKMMAKDPVDRYQRPTELIADLDSLQMGTQVEVGEDALKRSTLEDSKVPRLERRRLKARGPMKPTGRSSSRPKTRTRNRRVGTTARNAPIKERQGRLALAPYAIAGALAVLAVAAWIVMSAGERSFNPIVNRTHVPPPVVRRNVNVPVVASPNAPKKQPQTVEAAPAPPPSPAKSAYSAAQTYEAHNLGKRAAATVSYRAVAADFPGTPEARLALLDVIRLESMMGSSVATRSSEEPGTRNKDVSLADSGRNLLVNGAIGDDVGPGPPRGWRGPWGAMSTGTLMNEGGYRYLRMGPGNGIDQIVTIESTWTAFRFSALVRARGIQRGPHQWSWPSVRISWLGPDGKSEVAPGSTFWMLTEDLSSWMAVREEVRIPTVRPHIARLEIFQLAKAGTFDMDDITLAPESGAKNGPRAEAGRRGADVARGLVAHWTFDKSAGDIIRDSSGNGLDAIVHGAKRGAGTNGEALYFDGAGNYIITPDLTSRFRSLGLSISLWFKADDVGVLASQLGQSDLGGRWHASAIEIVGPAREVRVGVWNIGSVLLGTARLGEWHHVVLRYDETTDTLDGFLDGFESAAIISKARTLPPAQYFAFGAQDETNLGDGTWFDGAMDDVRIHNRALSPEEVKALFEMGGKRSVRPGASSRAAGGDWQTIFDGANLDGWKCTKNARTEDGCLVVGDGADALRPGPWHSLELSLKFRANGASNAPITRIELGNKPPVGRGRGRVLILMHGDGDTHIWLGGERVHRTGSGKFSAGSWVCASFKMTETTFSMAIDEYASRDIDISRAPVVSGGVQLGGNGGTPARFKDIRIRRIAE